MTNTQSNGTLRMQPEELLRYSRLLEEASSSCADAAAVSTGRRKNEATLLSVRRAEPVLVDAFDRFSTSLALFSSAVVGQLSVLGKFAARARLDYQAQDSAAEGRIRGGSGVPSLDDSAIPLGGDPRLRLFGAAAVPGAVSGNPPVKGPSNSTPTSSTVPPVVSPDRQGAALPLAGSPIDIPGCRKAFEEADESKGFDLYSAAGGLLTKDAYSLLKKTGAYVNFAAAELAGLVIDTNRASLTTATAIVRPLVSIPMAGYFAEEFVKVSDATRQTLLDPLDKKVDELKDKTRDDLFKGDDK